MRSRTLLWSRRGDNGEQQRQDTSLKRRHTSSYPVLLESAQDELIYLSSTCERSGAKAEEDVVVFTSRTRGTRMWRDGRTGRRDAVQTEEPRIQTHLWFWTQPELAPPALCASDVLSGQDSTGTWLHTLDLAIISSFLQLRFIISVVTCFPLSLPLLLLNVWTQNKTPRAEISCTYMSWKWNKRLKPVKRRGGGE